MTSMTAGNITIRSGGPGEDWRDSVTEVARNLNITLDQVRALCRNGILDAAWVEAEGDWRISGATTKIYPAWWGGVPERTDSYYMDLWRFLAHREPGGEWDQQLRLWLEPAPSGWAH